MNPRIIVALGFLGALLSQGAAAQTGGVYSIPWSTTDGGGQTLATGGVYQMGGTAGQPDAGQVSGGVYSLQGGFWVPALQPTVGVPPLDPLPTTFMARVAPNPFHSSTALAFDLPVASRVQLVLYGVDGRVVRRLAEGHYDAGRHRAMWDGRDDSGRPVGSGIYFGHLVAGEFKSVLRIVRLD